MAVPEAAEVPDVVVPEAAGAEEDLPSEQEAIDELALAAEAEIAADTAVEQEPEALEPVEPEIVEPEIVEPEIVEPETVEPEPAEPETEVTGADVADAALVESESDAQVEAEIAAESEAPQQRFTLRRLLWGVSSRDGD